MIPLVTASEAGTAQSENPRPWPWELWSRGAHLQVALARKWLLRQPSEDRNRRVPCRLTPVTVRILRVVLLGTAAQSGR